MNSVDQQPAFHLTNITQSIVHGKPVRYFFRDMPAAGDKNHAYTKNLRSRCFEHIAMQDRKFFFHIKFGQNSETQNSTE